MKPQHVLIVSDTHSKDIVYYQVVKKEAPLTMVVHAGDAEGQDDRLIFANEPEARSFLLRPRQQRLLFGSAVRSGILYR